MPHKPGPHPLGAAPVDGRQAAADGEAASAAPASVLCPMTSVDGGRDERGQQHKDEHCGEGQVGGHFCLTFSAERNCRDGLSWTMIGTMALRSSRKYCVSPAQRRRRPTNLRRALVFWRQSLLGQPLLDLEGQAEFGGVPGPRE